MSVPLCDGLPTCQFDANGLCASLRDGLRPTLPRESPAEPGRGPEVGPAELQPTLNPYACDLRVHQLPVSL
jgi:hypothetical protein